MGGTMCRKHKYRGHMDVKERCFLAYFFIAVDKEVSRQRGETRSNPQPQSLSKRIRHNKFNFS